MWNSAIIGLGQVGMGYDIDVHNDDWIVTHASGFHYHPDFQLVAGVDPDKSKCTMFEKRYNISAYPTLDELYKKAMADVVVISVPTEDHFRIFQAIINHAPVAIICEKPLSMTVAQAEEMVKVAKSKNVLLVVNYIRRFDPGIIKLKKWLSEGGLGEVYKATVWYSKGVLNNSSHFIDLLIYFFGEATGVKVIEKGRIWRKVDPEPDFKLLFSNGLVAYFFAGKEEYFSLMEIDIVGTKGRVRLVHGGEEVQQCKTETDPSFPGYTVLNETKCLFKTELNRYQYHVLENLSQTLRNNKPLFSTGETAISTHKVIEEIYRAL